MKWVVAQKCSLALWIPEKKLQEQICPPKCPQGHPKGPIRKNRAKSTDVKHFEMLFSADFTPFFGGFWEKG